MFSSVFVCMCGSPLCLIVCWVLYFFLVSVQTTTEKKKKHRRKKLHLRVEDEVLRPSSLSDCKFSGYNVGIFHSKNAHCVMIFFFL